jgi:hypothetical protein
VCEVQMVAPTETPRGTLNSIYKSKKNGGINLQNWTP